MAVQHSAAVCDRYEEDRLDWRRALPVLRNATVTLRELKPADAPALLAHICTPPVCQYIAAPPASVEGFQRFIRWTRMERRRGALFCFGIIPAGQSEPMGLIQVRSRDPQFSSAEWGFALAEPLWGTGVFVASARLVLEFAFTRLGVLRLEARAAEPNGRGNGVLQKLGATREGTLRRGFRFGDSCLDDVMWSILAEEWVSRATRH